MKTAGFFVAVVSLMLVGCGDRNTRSGPTAGTEVKADPVSSASTDGSPWTTVVKPKPLSSQVTKGLEYLANQQLSTGGWGQGGGWRTAGKSGGRVQEGGKGYKPQADVGNTAIAVLAFVRAGNTPTEGRYKENVRRGLDYILASIEKSDDGSMFVTETRGTQIQSKIGTYADTFLSLTTLAELKGQMSTDKENDRLVANLSKVIGKIEGNQKDDGSYEGNRGWASVLSQSFGNKGLNRAKQAGAKVNEKTLARVQSNSSSAYGADGKFSGGTGKAAGVNLYAESAAMAGMSDSDNSAAQDEADAVVVVRSPTAKPAQKQAARSKIKVIRQRRSKKNKATKQMVAKLSSERFVSGFGSAGGEEYISYMNISETLAAKGGDEWKKWDQNITKALVAAQNDDGSWVGHHCITGRTFLTASALLTLMADRAPVPVEVAKLAIAKD